MAQYILSLQINGCVVYWNLNGVVRTQNGEHFYGNLWFLPKTLLKNPWHDEDVWAKGKSRNKDLMIVDLFASLFSFFMHSNAPPNYTAKRFFTLD